MSNSFLWGKGKYLMEKDDFEVKIWSDNKREKMLTNMDIDDQESKSDAVFELKVC